jgi:hypothetical protein
MALSKSHLILKSPGASSFLSKLNYHTVDNIQKLLLSFHIHTTEDDPMFVLYSEIFTNNHKKVSKDELESVLKNINVEHYAHKVGQNSVYLADTLQNIQSTLESLKTKYYMRNVQLYYSNDAQKYVDIKKQLTR